ncbi:MAG: alpha/beta fold hydrolase [bacterium]|nr:alpha/beta fold hydrolase [bacterium]
MRHTVIPALACATLFALVACPAARAELELKANAGQFSEAVAGRMPGVQTVPAGAKLVSLTTTDGWRIAGHYWPPSGKQAPAVILLHQRGRDKTSWGALPKLLTKQGYAVLAIDLRGHGESKAPGGKRVAVSDLTDADFCAMLGDVAAADKHLTAQSGVDKDRIGIIGASIGANLAVAYLAGDRRVRTAVCLSPGLDYKGLRPLDFMEKVDKRPLYLLATKGDKYSADSAAQISKAGTTDGPKSLRLFEGSEHGTDMLAANEGLAVTIASGWLLNYLPPVR